MARGFPWKRAHSGVFDQRALPATRCAQSLGTNGACRHICVQWNRHLALAFCVVHQPLHCACREGHHRVTAALLKSGARVWLKEQDLCTALHLAAFFGHTDCVRLLLHYGASVTALNAFGQTPLDEANVQAQGVPGPGGGGPREVASILSQAEELQAWERLEFENQGVPSDQAGRDAWDEWDEPGEVLPDDEDGLGGPWEISAIHNRLYGLADERLYYTAAGIAIGVAALLPALVSLPLLFFFRGDLSDDDGGPSDKTWRGSGGSGIWSCCIPWHPSFYVVVANVIPAGLLAIHLRSKVPYSNQIHQLSLRRAKHRTSGLGYISAVQSTWAMLALLLAITNLTNLIIATSVSVAVLHAIIIVENYCILAAVRKTANFLRWFANGRCFCNFGRRGPPTHFWDSYCRLF